MFLSETEDNRFLFLASNWRDIFDAKKKRFLEISVFAMVTCLKKLDISAIKTKQKFDTK